MSQHTAAIGVTATLGYAVVMTLLMGFARQLNHRIISRLDQAGLAREAHHARRNNSTILLGSGLLGFGLVLGSWFSATQLAIWLLLAWGVASLALLMPALALRTGRFCEAVSSRPA